VQPKDLDKMQQCFEQLMALQRLAVGGSHLGYFPHKFIQVVSQDQPGTMHNWHTVTPVTHGWLMIRGVDMEWKDHWPWSLISCCAVCRAALGLLEAIQSGSIRHGMRWLHMITSYCIHTCSWRVRINSSGCQCTLVCQHDSRACLWSSDGLWFGLYEYSKKTESYFIMCHPWRGMA
jgi:hypothetical protein